ncbi:hypothetical protein SAMN04487965_3226 [Microbulbifer donghaiensis]|uniref:Scaffold protein FimL second domain-containing protein n=1 Tax=Microbulbifer donghaiensis TaxID=494016 RepID=A0A1M5GR79_9GAMM|nr:hypothetical protein [Microbulbifer donghaiensis]SHG06137.1 hypothetical protein SAMN04487965_3226 [Microbulbifer donghaiensis]
MTELRDINITSVNVVKDELVVAIDGAAAYLDQFAADNNNQQALEQCLAALRQVSGVLQMVQLHAGDLLAQEMLSALADLQQGRQEATIDLMEGLGSGFYVLTRYLDFVQNRGTARPELLIPYINTLRAARSQAPVPESHFFRCRLDASVPGAVSAAVMSEDLRNFVRRFRHMYQVGLLALLKGKPSKPAYTMMARALQRVASVSAGRPNGRLWAVAGAALGGMASAEMQVNRSRVMVFSMFDRRLRALQKDGDAALDQPAPPVLLKECLYWLALSSPAGHGTKLLEAFSVRPLGYSEAELERERASLGGPGATAINAVAGALDEELSGVRRMLDDVELIGASGLDEEDGLLGTLQRVASTLQLLNFKRVGEGLRGAVQEYRTAAGAGGSVADAALQKLTGQVLMVDSTIRALRQSSSIDLDEFGHADVALEHSQLAEAEVAVLKEAEAGLSLIKRALASYADSGFDHGHIRNVATTLNSVRGGLIVLNLRRAAAVVERLVDFVETVMEHHDSAPAVEQSLDIFADAIISLEYYLGEVKLHRKADIQSLNLAVESLEALGYPVEVA